MFICDKCLEEGFANSQTLFKSVGPCEFCHKTSECNDIRAGLLEPKDTPRKRPEGEKVNANSDDELRR